MKKHTVDLQDFNHIVHCHEVNRSGLTMKRIPMCLNVHTYSNERQMKE